MSLLPTSPESSTPAADAYVLRIRESQVILHRELLKARSAMETSANRRRRPAPDLVPGQLVWLLRRHITTRRPSRKLDVRRLGPFAIVELVGKSAYRLQLPPSMQVHPVFHVSLLELHVANTFPGRVVPPPLPTHVDGFPEFEVNKILSSKLLRGKLFYLVDWVGYDGNDQSWEPAANVAHVDEAVAAFHIACPDKPGPQPST